MNHLKKFASFTNEATTTPTKLVRGGTQAVANFQQKLIDAGYDIKADGAWGKQTRTAYHSYVVKTKGADSPEAKKAAEDMTKSGDSLSVPSKDIFTFFGATPPSTNGVSSFFGQTKNGAKLAPKSSGDNVCCVVTGEDGKTVYVVNRGTDEGFTKNVFKVLKETTKSKPDQINTFKRLRAISKTPAAQNYLNTIENHLNDVLKKYSNVQTAYLRAYPQSFDLDKDPTMLDTVSKELLASKPKSIDLKAL